MRGSTESMRGIRIKLLEPSAVLNQELVLVAKNGILRVCFTEINVLAYEVHNIRTLDILIICSNLLLLKSH